MRWIILWLICFNSISAMAQLESKDLIGSYHHTTIASGERAKVDRANYYSTIELKKDGTFLWTDQQGRLSATFRYRYGGWKIEEQEIILTIEAQALDLQHYHKSNNGYGNNPYDKALKRRAMNSVYYLIAEQQTGGRVRGLKYVEDYYEKR